MISLISNPEILRIMVQTKIKKPAPFSQSGLLNNFFEIFVTHTPSPSGRGRGGAVT